MAMTLVTGNTPRNALTVLGDRRGSAARRESMLPHAAVAGTRGFPQMNGVVHRFCGYVADLTDGCGSARSSPVRGMAAIMMAADRAVRAQRRCGRHQTR